MKTKHYLMLVLATFLAIGCNTNAQNMKGKKILIAYFSQSGNTKVVASKIKELTGADIFEITPVKPYPKDYQGVLKRSKEEIDKGIKPALSTKIDNIKDYDIILIGSPCWYGTVACPVSTFLSTYELKGKSVAVFMTHGGSGLKDQEVKKLCTGAKVLEGIGIYDSDINNSQPQLETWLKKIGVL